jgi:purine-nucleoside phosphorylase
VTVFVFALPFEAAGFQPKSGEVWVLGCAGVGAAVAFEKKLASAPRPNLVISTGLAGALQPGLKPGDLLIGEDSDSAFLKRLENVSGFAWKRGRIATVDSVMATSAAKARLAEQTSAHVCDMETARIAAICSHHNLRFAAIRVVSDSLAFEMPVPPDVLANPSTGKPNLPALAAYLLRHPTKIPDFFQMVADASLAKKRLAEFLTAMA